MGSPYWKVLGTSGLEPFRRKLGDLWLCVCPPPLWWQRMGKIPPRLSGGACNVLYMHQKCHSSSTTRVANCESGANKCRHCTLALKLEHPEPQLTPPSISSLTFTCPRNKPLMSRIMFLIFLGGTYLEKGKSLSAMFIWTSTNHNQGESWLVGWQGGVVVWKKCE